MKSKKITNIENIRKKKKELDIKVFLDTESNIYNEFNNNQLSDELSNYIYNQCKGTPESANLSINIIHNFKMSDEEKIKLVDSIRENFGLDVKENLLKFKHKHLIYIFLVFLGTILLIGANFFNNHNTYLLSEIISICGSVIIWEIVYNIIFVETQMLIETKRLKKLTKVKIKFSEINDY